MLRAAGARARAAGGEGSAGGPSAGGGATGSEASVPGIGAYACGSGCSVGWHDASASQRSEPGRALRHDRCIVEKTIA